MNNPGRRLTPGEIAMARRVFGAAIDYAAVRIHNASWLPFGLQQRHTAMAPNGHIYFRDPLYRTDFSVESAGWAMFFMHEMVHVWQWQLGFSVIWHGLLLALGGGYWRRRAYRYDPLAAPKPLGAYNMEQQGDLIADYFGARCLGLADYQARLPFLDAVLADFLRSGADRGLLPR